jgi:hypothetical protein
MAGDIFATKIGKGDKSESLLAQFMTPWESKNRLIPSYHDGGRMNG